MAMAGSQYGGFREDNDPYYLGVAKDSSKVWSTARVRMLIHMAYKEVGYKYTY